MELITFESDAYFRLQAEQNKIMMQAVEMAITKALNQSKEMDWIPFEKAQNLLPFKGKTRWQELRDSGDIEFSKFGRKILYSKKSIEAFIIKNKK